MTFRNPDGTTNALAQRRLTKTLFLDRNNLALALHSLGCGVILALSAAPFRSLGRDVIYWVVQEANQPSRTALILDEIGYRGHQLTIISDFIPEGGWPEWIAADSWLQSARNIDIQLYGEAATIEDGASAENYIQSTQHIVFLHEWSHKQSLSKNTIRNVTKAAHFCTPTVNNTAVGVRDYVDLVGSSDDRRAAKGQASDGHQLDDVWNSIKEGTSSLYFARNDQENISAVRISVLGDRAYYLMGGTSEKGFLLGASHYLLVHVINELKHLGFKSLTLGVANSDGLVRFKRGLGAKAIATKRLQITGSPPHFSWRLIDFKLKLNIKRLGRRLLNRPQIKQGERRIIECHWIDGHS